MLTIAAPANAKGQVIGFMMTAVSISLIIMASVVANMMRSNPMNHNHIAFVMIVNTVIPSLLASFCYLMAGADYEKTLKEQQQDKVLSMAAALTEVPEIANNH
jgi:uncharacterized membrane protein